MPKKLECNYDRNIFTQLEETIQLTEKLRAEINELKAAHRQEKYIQTVRYDEVSKELKKFDKDRREIADFKEYHKNEISSLKENNTKTLKALKAAQSEEVRELKEIIAEQALELAQLRAENQALRDIVNKNSGNSSKPPSSDGLKKIHNSRTPTGKKPGGQRGHKGEMPHFYEKPTKIVEIKRKKCDCGGHVCYLNAEYTRKQYIDIEIKTNVIEYREYTGVCKCCGCAVANRSPVKDSITYGNKLKSFSNMLSVEGNVSINRIHQMLAELSGGMIKISEGTICKWNKDLSKLLAPSIQSIKEKLLTSPVLHKDETGVWVNTKLNWFHVLSNDKHTLYYAQKRRGKDADTEAGVLPAFKGVLVHDNLKSLYHFNCTHAECNAHILRYLKAAVESRSRRWAKDMIEFLLYAKEKSENAALQQSDIDELHHLYDDILELGQAEFLRGEKPNYSGDDWKLLRRMREFKTQHLMFLSDRNVPFDNNQAERDLRMIKAKTKISGCFRSTDGDGIFATLKSYTSSLRKNGLNIFDALVSAWDAMPVLF